MPRNRSIDPWTTWRRRPDRRTDRRQAPSRMSPKLFLQITKTDMTMFKSCDLKASPVENADWWAAHVRYSIFNRQGLDIICATFENPRARGNVIFLTGWNETFLRYPELIKVLYDAGFSVFTYDHQSQGFSGRWLADSQSTWMHSFQDYVDDFVYFSTTVSREFPRLPVYLIAHSMGCLIASLGLVRHPSLVSRAVFSSPMFRNKCGIKSLDMRLVVPQLIAHWMSYCASQFGLGAMNTLGYFREDPKNPISLKLTKDQDQLANWQRLRQLYPEAISCCVTNDWLLNSLRAQNKFSQVQSLVKTNCLIFEASDDVFVYNRAMATFVQKAPSSRMFTCPDTYHDLFAERPEVRYAIYRAILTFLNQASDDVMLVDTPAPLELFDITTPLFSFSDIILRSFGLGISVCGIIVGASMMFGSRKTLGQLWSGFFSS